MKTIPCAHPPHHHNGFVATCRLCTASGGVHVLLVLEPTECSTSKGAAPKACTLSTVRDATKVWF